MTSVVAEPFGTLPDTDPADCAEADDELRSRKTKLTAVRCRDLKEKNVLDFEIGLAIVPSDLTDRLHSLLDYLFLPDPSLTTAAPALLTISSCESVPPEQPIAPMITPSSISGMPP